MDTDVRSRAPVGAPSVWSRATALVRRELRAPAVWPVLDGVRGVAVLAAVVWHVLRLYPAATVTPDSVPVLLWPFGALRFCVDVFFVLSGFLVIRSWQSIRQRASAPRAWFAFITRRAARILPAYWVSLAILVPLVAPVLFEQPRRLLAFVTLNQYVKFWLPERVNVVYWSLTTEWHFYLLVPLVSFLLVRVGRIPVLSACLVTSVLWYLHPPFRLPASFVFGRLDQFVFGAIVGQLVVSHMLGDRSFLLRVVQHRRVPIVIIGGLLALGTYHGSSLGMGRRSLLDAMLHPLVGFLVAAALLRMLTGSPPRLFTNATARFFGLISFGLYIWHYPILEHGRGLQSMAVPLPSWLWSSMVVAMLFAVGVAAATVSYFAIERPFVRRKKTSRNDDSPHAEPSDRARRELTLEPALAR
jgi:peptidoglycan/LPS O-acetylase OafA/YrhL